MKKILVLLVMLLMVGCEAKGPEKPKQIIEKAVKQEQQIDKTKEESDCFTLGRLITRTLKFQKYLKLNGRKDSMMDVYLLDLRRIMREKLD